MCIRDRRHALRGSVGKDEEVARWSAQAQLSHVIAEASASAFRRFELADSVRRTDGLAVRSSRLSRVMPNPGLGTDERNLRFFTPHEPSCASLPPSSGLELFALWIVVDISGLKWYFLA